MENPSKRDLLEPTENPIEMADIESKVIEDSKDKNVENTNKRPPERAKKTGCQSFFEFW